MTSIRRYLIVSLLATMVIIIFVSVLQGYRSSMREAERLFDSKLVETAHLIAAFDPEGPKYGGEPLHESAYQVWSYDNRLLQYSSNTPATMIAPLKSGFNESNFSEARWRIYSFDDRNHRRWILVGERIDQRFILAERVILESVFPFLTSLPVAGMIIWLLVGRGLYPLTQLARQLTTKRSEDLSLISLDSPPRELLPVQEAVNELLARLQLSFERERRFSADAAHEIRTPISALKTHFHNLAGEIPDRALENIQADVNRLQHLLEQMLLLYRTTPEHYQAAMESLNLHSLAQSVIGELYPQFENKGQSIELIGSSASLWGDRFALQLALKNLLLNANKYCGPHCHIRVIIEKLPHQLTLTVADNGGGVADSDLRRIFDRFYRAGGDRHASKTTGCGLGLSIVLHIAELHGATVDATNNREGGLSVSLRFPTKETA